MAATVDNFLNTFNQKFEPPVRTHLKNVYTTLTMSIITAAGGAYAALYTSLPFLGLASLGGFAAAIALFMTPDNGKNRSLRLGFLLGFAFASGVGLGPLLDLAIAVNPTIIPSALMLTAGIFASFSGAALFAPDGKYLYLGGICFSGLYSLMFLGLLNIFFRSQLLFQAHLYLGMAIFCGLIMFDTQIIIHKARMGDKDFVSHAMELFIDFIQVFRKVLIILLQKEDRSEKKKKN